MKITVTSPRRRPGSRLNSNSSIYFLKNSSPHLAVLLKSNTPKIFIYPQAKTWIPAFAGTTLRLWRTGNATTNMTPGTANENTLRVVTSDNMDYYNYRTHVKIKA